MLTTSFKSVIVGICALTGQKYSSLSVDQLASLTENVNQRLKECWQWEFWPELTQLDLRPYLLPWSPDANYGPGTKVFNWADWSYYQANQAPNQPPVGAQPSATSPYWCRTFVPKIVPLDMTGFTSIGEVHRITQRDPRINPRFPQPLAFTVTNQGILVAPLAGAAVWIEYRLRPSVFGSTLWNSATNNNPGDIVFRPFTTGECYLATGASQAPQAPPPEANGANWTLINFPDRFANPVKRLVYADFLRASGQQDKAQAEEAGAYLQLDQASDVVLASQGQYERATAQVTC